MGRCVLRIDRSIPGLCERLWGEDSDGCIYCKTRRCSCFMQSERLNAEVLYLPRAHDRVVGRTPPIEIIRATLEHKRVLMKYIRPPIKFEIKRHGLLLYSSMLKSPKYVSYFFYLLQPVMITKCSSECMNRSR